jgi:hypothetical protein
MQSVHVAAGSAAFDRIAEVRIVSAGPNSLAGELAAGPARASHRPLAEAQA